MNNISTLHNCYGCGVCSAICPTQVIEMKLNTSGFFSPTIKNDNCINCGKCLNVCAFYSSNQTTSSNNNCYYAGYSKDNHVRLNASSGGVAYELAKNCIEKGYKVVTVKYNNNSNLAEHYIASSLNDLTDSYGSKYIQSITTDSLKEIFKLIDKKVAIFGTPCQISSIRKFYGNLNQNVLLIDFFCHGVPSYLMWHKYCASIKAEIGEITDVKWRDKSNGGWHNSWNMVLTGKNGKIKSAINQGDLFYKFFLRNRCLNACCYDSCKFKMNNSDADIRIGDLWGERYKSDQQGINGIITFTSLGKEVINNLHNCILIPESADIVMEAQMRTGAKRPASYSFVNTALKTDKTLECIDKTASKYEFWLDKLPNMSKYYTKRIFQILFKK